jgi:hypothetical protein
MSGFFRFDRMQILASYEHASFLAPSHVLGRGYLAEARMAHGSRYSNRYRESGRFPQHHP